RPVLAELAGPICEALGSQSVTLAVQADGERARDRGVAVRELDASNDRLLDVTFRMMRGLFEKRRAEGPQLRPRTPRPFIIFGGRLCGTDDERAKQDRKSTRLNS